MTQFVKVPLEGGPAESGDRAASAVVLIETAESDLVSLHGAKSEVLELSEEAVGRLAAIADAAEQMYRSVTRRLRPDRVELELSVGLSGEVGWFVAKSSAAGGMKLKLSWETAVPPGSDAGDEVDTADAGTAGRPVGL